MNAQDLALALARTTLATTAACGLAWLLLTKLRIDSPRVHRLAWTLAIFQGWLLFPFTFEMAATATPVSRDAVAERMHAATAPPSLTANLQTTSPTRRSYPLLDAPLIATIPIAAWLAGAGALAAVGVCRYVRVLRSLPLGSPPDDPAWQIEWRRLLDAARIPSRRRVDLRMTTDLGPLLCWTPWTYLVLAPQTLWAALTSPERQSILRHELAHLQRNDLWKSLAIRVLALPQWFNPLARLAVRRFDEAGEWACDDAAAGAAAGGSIAFANSLLRAAEFASAELPGSLAASGGVLSRRIHRLVTPRFKDESKMKVLLIPMLLAVLGVAQLIRIERVAAEESDTATKSQPFILSSHGKKAQTVGEWMSQPSRSGRETKLPAYIVEPPDVLYIKMNSGVPSRGRPVISPSLLTGGKFLVNPDGNIYLPPYGKVNVTGKTLTETRTAIERKLARDWENPEVYVDVHGYNSKVYFMVAGDQIVRQLITGNETVMDAVAAFGGAPQAPAARMWIARPASDGHSGERILPISWNDIAEGASTSTNYQLLPGDRLFMETPPSPPTPAAPPVPVAPQIGSSTPSDGAVDYEMSVLEDAQGHLAEFESLRDGAMLDEKGAVRDALRLLEKNGLVKCVANPQLKSRLGLACVMKIGSPAADEGGQLHTEFAINVCARRVFRTLLVDIRMKRRVDGKDVTIDTRLKMESGQTIILAANGPPTKSKGEAAMRRTYLVLTPTLVK